MLGNIGQKSFVDLWQNYGFLGKMRNRDIFKEGYSKYDYVKACGGCRARAFAYFGDVWVNGLRMSN